MEIINSKALLEYLHKLINVLDGLKLNERLLVVEELLKGIQQFDKLNDQRAMKKTLENASKLKDQ